MTRFVSCVVLFVLGLRAPGIMTNRDYFNLSNSSTELNIQIDVSTLADTKMLLTWSLVSVYDRPHLSFAVSLFIFKTHFGYEGITMYINKRNIFILVLKYHFVGF